MENIFSLPDLYENVSFNLIRRMSKQVDKDCNLHVTWYLEDQYFQRWTSIKCKPSLKICLHGMLELRIWPQMHK